MAERRHAQSVADAAALAAAYSLYNNYATNQGLDPSGMAARDARSIASGNGYTNDGVTSTVTVNIPPVTGSFVGKSGYAEVNVRCNQPRCFSVLWGSGTMAVTARTVARGISSPSSPAILLLDPTMSKALNGAGNGSFTVTGGSNVVDSSAHPPDPRPSAFDSSIPGRPEPPEAINPVPSLQSHKPGRRAGLLTR
jgi:hypothetical protein